MTDWLARFRELVKDDSRFSLGADSAIRANSSPLNGDRGADTRKTSAIGPIGPFGTAARESGQLSDTPNQSVEIDWQALFDERAAIRECDGRHTRAEAERLAWGELEPLAHAARRTQCPRHMRRLSQAYRGRGGVQHDRQMPRPR